MGVLPVPDLLIDLGKDVSRVLKSLEAAERRVSAFNTQVDAIKQGFERLKLMGDRVDSLQRTLLSMENAVRALQDTVDRKR